MMMDFGWTCHQELGCEVVGLSLARRELLQDFCFLDVGFRKMYFLQLVEDNNTREGILLNLVFC